MFVMKTSTHRFCSITNMDCEPCHTGHRFKNHSIMCGVAYIVPPAERTVVRDQNCRDRTIVDLLKGANDGMPRVQLVFGDDFGVLHNFCDRDGAVKIVGMGSAKAWDGASRLGPSRGILRM